ncbi:RNA polymerase sigma factor, sigma-70 family [Chthonomonas calidirosea]|uniref:RNA polymerase sigma factor, sigma-70 family n=1 Tax=Chthonomonas calidirosea (strain DSM 23976 / ICMP 18418 / T49) TaxID=1303518 RepID=S0EZV5_CHTCT|nr:sigma-70 family RNA polymerase sigma factor [Chthonomonas calidirosea]CCW36100.1 RNA polymerase sigma factor, sigma-70 family [Chthonomonas calidirosea T49]CEK18338.1 RNA polymerase sigma factor, sigma-70 family [Chthonomonas calidirosea]
MNNDGERDFSKLYQEVCRKLRAHAPNQEELLEAVQEAWTRCYEHHKQDLPDHELVAWLLKTGKNYLIDTQRTKRHQRSIQEQLAYILDRDITLDKDFDHTDQTVCILQLAQTLPPVERQIILLVLSGNDLKTIAEILELQYPTVAKRYERACQHIRARYQEACRSVDGASPLQDEANYSPSEEDTTTNVENDNAS